MNTRTKLLLSLSQVEGISKLMKDNESEHYINSFLVPIHVELNRQLTNLTESSKMKE